MKWIPVSEKLPDVDVPILLSFENTNFVMIGRYTVDDEDSGTFRVDDDYESFVEHDMFVNAWMPLPEPYRKDEELPECCDDCYYHSVRPSPILGLVDECDLGKHRMEERDGDWWYGGEGRPKACPLNKESEVM